MDRLKYYVNFHFAHKKELRLIITASWQKKSINLAHSSFLLFLYNNESNLDSQDSEFSYSLAKYLKKISVGQDLHHAIVNDDDMAWFFLHVKKYDIHLEWRHNKHRRAITFTQQIPLKIRVRQEKEGIVCTMPQRDVWLKNPLSWLCLKGKKDTLYFSLGRIIINPPKSLVKFLNRFLDQNKLLYRDQEAMMFVQQIYSPNKRILHWYIRAKLQNFLPNEDPPIPVLHIRYENNILSSQLFYQYGDEQIDPNFEGDTVKDSKTGKFHKRSLDMEVIFQNDLMNLFMEHDLPFLLENPGDITKFLDNVIPILEEREWQIISDTEEFKLNDSPIDIQFDLHSSDNNLFSFDSHYNIDGKAIPFQEMARLMVENQGYIKTSTGFAKINEKTQNDLEVLSKFGAFQKDKTFKKSELLPLLASTSKIQSENKETKSFIEKFNSIQQFTKIEPGDDFKGELRDYQQFGMSWIDFLYSNDFGGVLADDMGLGKTVQTLAFANQVKEEGPILVIGPTNVLYNWEKEIQKFTENKKVIIYSGSQRHDLANKIMKQDFIITSFGILKNDIELFVSLPFKAIFIDEAQNIKNPNTQVSKAAKRLNAPFKLAMTGTPIENHLQDLWNIFDFVMPNYLGSYRDFDQLMKEGSNEYIKSKIRPFVLRRIKKEVLDSLPEKTEITIKCSMSEEQKQLYETVLTAAKKGIQNTSGKNERLNVLTALLKLRQVCIHPGLLKEINGGSSIGSGKFDVVKEKIDELIDEGHKIVMFSQFTKMLDIIEEWTKSSDFYTERIDGSVSSKARMTAIDRFQESDSAGVFLVSLKAGGVGINLTAADYVIHLDPWWNPAIESQATDRVHRLGQKNKVIVYKLITEGTIEEKIQDLQESKRQLLSEIIDIDSAADKTLNFEEIKQLLV